MSDEKKVEVKEDEGLDPNRVKILEEYAKLNPGVPTPKDEIPLEVTELSPEEIEKKEPPKEENIPPVEETEKQQRERETKDREKSENLKKALDEERAKRKHLREEKENLEAIIRNYEAQQTKAQPEIDDSILDYESELKTVKSKLRSIELMEARREEFARQEAIRAEADKLQSMVKSVDSSLEKEGFPGFEYMAGMVTRELISINAIDPEEAKSLDNPDGWQKLYKEKIFPTFKQKFEESIKKSVLDKKVSLKEQANLATGPGKSPVSKKDEDDPKNWTEERRMAEYRKVRGL